MDRWPVVFFPRFYMSVLPTPSASSESDAHEADARIQALHDLGLLDGASSDAFDRSVRIASRALRAPVSLFSLVDDRRQVFKAQTGLTGPFAETGQTPLSHSFCRHVVTNRAPLIVTDAREHPRVRENLAIRDLGVVAYLGVPVRSPDGHVLGALCAIQGTPRDWTEDEVALLGDIAADVDTIIALQVEKMERQRIRERLETSNGRLHHVLESTGDGIVLVDANWRIQYANGRFVDLTEIADDPTGKTLWDLFPEAVGNAFWREYHAAVDARETTRVVAYYPPLQRWFEADATPSSDGLTIFFRDITPRHEAEEARKLMIRELHHRIKNLFAILTGLVSMTARTTDTPTAMAKALRQRLHSLARAHELIRPAVTLEATETSDTTCQRQSKIRPRGGAKPGQYWGAERHGA
ncbi:GAF domain-containing protein, partial [uncultured Jannaschia sp.]|uniref:GAF domain-containing protein n=1 Tax=uncultured Jannaschia sp. TaxID=293347 RepID=UPI00262479CA